MESDNTTCRTLFHKIHLMSDTNIHILLACNIIVSITNMVVNSLVIYLIYYTKQYRNSSLRLTLYMSISDFMVGFISQHMMTYFLLEAHSKLSCQLQVILQYVLYLFPHITGFFVGLVALDRYCRVKYTNKYPDVMTFKRQTIGLIVVIILAILNCMVLISGIFTGNWTLALVGIQPLDSTFVFCDVFLYWRAIVLMKEHVKNKTIDLKSFSKSISRLATIYLVLVIIFYPPYLLLDMVQAFIDSNKTSVVFWHILTLIWVFLNSGVNAVSFLIVNRKARRKLKEMRRSLYPCCSLDIAGERYEINNSQSGNNNNIRSSVNVKDIANQSESNGHKSPDPMVTTTNSV